MSRFVPVRTFDSCYGCGAYCCSVVSLRGLRCILCLVLFTLFDFVVVLLPCEVLYFLSFLLRLFDCCLLLCFRLWACFVVERLRYCCYLRESWYVSIFSLLVPVAVAVIMCAASCSFLLSVLVRGRLHHCLSLR